jgi:hypothetical protein
MAAGGGASGSGAAKHACMFCSAERVDESWLAAFGVALCWGCKKQDSLVNKTKAKVSRRRRLD